MIKSIIVDDEEKSRETLKHLLNKHCQHVEVLHLCGSVTDAEKIIEVQQPDLVFLDIEMPFNNGFDLLERFPKPEFQIIFITAFDHYALRAIKFAALDYLLKPVDVDELKAAVNKVQTNPESQVEKFRNLELLLSSVKSKSAKIAVPTFEGLQMINADEIISCTADECYTNITLVDGKKIMVSKLLKDYESLLGPYNFLRIHNSCLINLTQVSRYVKGEGGYVVMNDGQNCEVSRRKKTELISRLSLLQL